MSKLEKIAKISNNLIQSTGVQALANRPNESARYGEGGLSAEQLKRKFDQLPSKLAEKINEIIDILTSSEGKDVCNYIKVGLSDEIVTLKDFVNSVSSGELSKVIKIYLTSEPDEGASLYDVLCCFDNDIEDLKPAVEDFNSAVDALNTCLPRGVNVTLDDEYKLSISIIDAEGKALGEAATVDLPLETMMVNLRYDPDDNSIYFELQNGTEVGPIALDELIEGLVSTNEFNNKLLNLRSLLSDKASYEYVDDKVANVGGVTIIDSYRSLAYLPSAKGKVLVKDLTITRSEIDAYNETYTGNLLPYPYTISGGNMTRDANGSVTSTLKVPEFESRTLTIRFASEEKPLILSPGTYTFVENMDFIGSNGYGTIYFDDELYLNGERVARESHIEYTLQVDEETTITDFYLRVSIDFIYNPTDPTESITDRGEIIVEPVLYDAKKYPNGLNFVARHDSEVYPDIPTKFNLSCDTIEFVNCVIGDDTDTEEEYIEFVGGKNTSLGGKNTSLRGISKFSGSAYTRFSLFNGVSNILGNLTLYRCENVSNVHNVAGGTVTITKCQCVSNVYAATDTNGRGGSAVLYECTNVSNVFGESEIYYCNYVTNVEGDSKLSGCFCVNNCNVSLISGCWFVSNSFFGIDDSEPNFYIDPATAYGGADYESHLGQIALLPDIDGKTEYLDPETLASKQDLKAEIDDINSVLEQFGAVSEHIVQETTNIVEVPSTVRVSKAAVINSFGGMTYKKSASGGGNLLPYPYVSIPDGATEVMGIVLGDNLSSHPILNVIDSTNALTLEAGTYTVDMGVGFETPYIWIRFADETIITALSCTETFTINEAKTIVGLGIQHDNPDTLSSANLTPVLYNVADYPDGFEFEPRYYNLDDTKVEQIIVRGKNLAQKRYNIKSSGTSLVSTVLAEDSTGKHCGSLIPVIGGKTYTLSKTGSADGRSAFRHFWFDKEPGLGETMSIGGAYNASSSTVVTTAPVTAKYLYVRWTEDDELYPCGDVQIEFGNVATEYVPYIEPTVVTVPDSIKTIDGYGTGLEGYPNVVDLDNDRFDTRSKTIVLTGTESIAVYAYASTRGIRIDNILDGIYGRQYGVCSHANVDEVGKIRAGDMWLGVASKHIFWLGMLDVLGFNSGDDNADVASFKDWLKAQYDAGHPVTIIYKTDLPTSEPLPVEMDGLIEIERGGSIEFVTDTGESVPVSVEFQIINQAEVTE